MTRRPALIGAVLSAALTVLPMPDAQAQTLAWQVEASAGLERLSNGTPDWRQVDVSLRRRFAAGAQAEITLREAQRYGRRDSEFAVGLALPLDDAWTVALRATAADAAHFLPSRGGQVELSRRLSAGWVASASLGRNRYDSAANPATGTSLLRLGAEHYVGAWRLAAGVTHARLDGGASADGWRAQVDRYIGDGGRIGLLVAGGRELESAPDGVISTRVDALVLVGRWPIAAGWALTGDVAGTRVGNIVRRTGSGNTTLPGGYRRNAGRIGVQHEF